MTERIVTKRLGIQDEIGNRLLEIRTQRDAHLSTSTINLQVNADGIERAAFFPPAQAYHRRPMRRSDFTSSEPMFFLT